MLMLLMSAMAVLCVECVACHETKVALITRPRRKLICCVN